MPVFSRYRVQRVSRTASTLSVSTRVTVQPPKPPPVIREPITPPSRPIEAAISTSAGSFIAEIEVAATSSLSGLGRYSASASVCGYSLCVYRLVSETDDGASLALRVGDRVMVELEGNATTGYTWTNAMEVEYAVLREMQEPEYRAASDLLGAPGVFLFRYVAVDVGPQTFRFIYHRPWESVEPLETVQFTVHVS